MLTYPPQSTPFRVLGIDPGTSELGVCMLAWWGYDRPVEVWDARTLHSDDRTGNPYHHLTQAHPPVIARLYDLETQFRSYLQHWRPHGVIAESPFVRHNVNTYAILTLCFNMLRGCLIEYNWTLPLAWVPPQRLKAGIGANLTQSAGEDTKAPVQEALLTTPQLDWRIDPTTLDEHAFDAIGAGYYYILHHLGETLWPY